MRALVIESDDSLQARIAQLLRYYGYTSDVAGNLDEGAALQISPYGSQYRLILCAETVSEDTPVPKEGNGLQYMHALRTESGVVTPIILLADSSSIDSFPFVRRDPANVTATMHELAERLEELELT